jgi:potassium-transporting ATPase KdpC subunit
MRGGRGERSRVGGRTPGQLRSGLVLVVAFTLLTGVAYPLAVTAIAQTAFPWRAGGSLIRRGGLIIGSELVGQPFSGAGYFWGRPSATGRVPYDAAASSGSNLGPLNRVLRADVERRIAVLRAAHPESRGPVPVDLVTASASGLDPHISPAAALYQLPRVARERGLPAPVVRELVRRHTAGRQLGILGEPRVNVLALNLALDSLDEATRTRNRSPR